MRMPTLVDYQTYLSIFSAQVEGRHIGRSSHGRSQCEVEEMLVLGDITLRLRLDVSRGCGDQLHVVVLNFAVYILSHDALPST